SSSGGCWGLPLHPSGSEAGDEMPLCSLVPGTVMGCPPCGGSPGGSCDVPERHGPGREVVPVSPVPVRPRQHRFAEPCGAEPCPCCPARAGNQSPPPGPGVGPELEAIKAKLREIEKEDERLKELQLEAENHLFVSSEAGMALFPLTTKEKMEADQRSIYVGNVDYGGTAEELESHFNSCGQINRVTILCDKFSGHPKGSVQCAGGGLGVCRVSLGLCSHHSGRERVQGPCHQGESWGGPGGLLPRFPALPAWGWAKPQLQQPLPTLQVLPKRTNMPGISSTDRGGYRGCFHARGGLGRWGGPYGQQPRMRGRTYR
uniref:PABPN1 like, cytoplasmic n=1 Tax=Serinus canaria TaxID=9135 RepID=A0A8C9MWX2_SERCA